MDMQEKKDGNRSSGPVSLLDRICEVLTFVGLAAVVVWGGSVIFFSASAEAGSSGDMLSVQPEEGPGQSFCEEPLPDVIPMTDTAASVEDTMALDSLTADSAAVNVENRIIEPAQSPVDTLPEAEFPDVGGPQEPAMEDSDTPIVRQDEAIRGTDE